MTELEQYIESNFDVPPSEVAALSTLFEQETLEKHSFYVKTGQPCGCLSFVRSGYLRVFKYYEGEDITQWISSKGEFIAELSGWIFGTPSRWNIQALTDCELYTISPSNYQRISTVVPQWPALERRFIAKCFVSLEDRVFSFLSLSAEERYLRLFEVDKELINQIPLQYLASMLGMSAETLSRIRRKLSS
ncbi:cyclic nucleotide-binding protein [Reichenbachiella sp. 5M10]|uniref:Crp/Fnr family transcriptional regulator n=1 Tax=Reichenbachiella sp. 5M10 TaxID=1889772 RepID=UPI000C1510B4|nr:Crp/Fnr family transcriptional regulator [Reichenbachiella sp. 5M10]PIB37605.1 cyclic nucleotide-binding protein [Reichenbachiella sp. 5M10]